MCVVRNLKMMFLGVGLLLTVSSMSDALSLHEMLAEMDSFGTRMKLGDVEEFEIRLGSSIAAAADMASRRKREAGPLQHGTKSILDRMVETITISEHITSLNGFEFNEEPFAVAIVQRSEEDNDYPKYLLKLYRIQGDEISTLQWIGLRSDGSLQVAQTDDTVLVVATDPHSSVVYALEDFALRQLQNLSFDANNVKLHVHQDKIILGVALETGFDFYEWESAYFDKKTSLALSSCASMELFTIDNTLYLATSSRELLAIWERSVQSGTFGFIQSIGIDGIANADDVAYFRIGEAPVDIEHYLAIASGTESAAIYKRDFEGIFQPFQDFLAKRIKQWLPYQKNDDEFALFGIEKSGVSAFVYDGYMFRENGVLMDRTLGAGCSYLHTFRTKKVTWMAAVNPSLKSASLEQAVFKTVAATEMAEVEDWCDEMENKKGTAVEELVSLTGDLPQSDHPVIFNGQVTFRRVNVTTLNAREFGIFTQELVDHINELSDKVDQLAALVADLDTLSLTYISKPVVLRGPISKSRLNVLCEDVPCSIPIMDVDLMNGDLLEQFLLDTVSLDDASARPLNMEFDHLAVKEATAPFINGKPARTLLYRDAKMILRNVTIAGSVGFSDHVFVHGTVADVLLDREHAVLTEGDQTMAGGLVMPEGVINHLSLSGQLNHVNVSQLSHAMPAALDEWRQSVLSVTNITILGNLDDVPFEDLLNGVSSDELEVEEMQVSSGEISGVKIADLIRTDQGEFYLKGDLNFSEGLSVDNLAVSDAINDIPLDVLMGSSELTAKEAADPIEIDNFNGNRVIVKNLQNLRDIVSPEGKSFLNWGDQLDPAVDNAEALDEEFTCVNPDGAKRIPSSGVQVTKRFDDDGKMYFEVDGPLTTSALVADELEVTGLIDHMNWTELMVDAVRQEETTTVSGRKKAIGSLNLSHLHVTDFLNGVEVEEVVKNYPEKAEDSVFAQDLLLESSLNVSEIVVNGLSIHKSDETDERVFAVNSSLQLGENAQVNKINGIDTDDFFSSAILINEDNIQLNVVNFVNPLQLDHLIVTGHLNGANFSDVFFTNSSELQIVSGSWLFRDNVGFNVEVSISGDTSGMDLKNLCRMTRGAPKVIVSGSVTSGKEPKGVKSVNHVETDGVMKNAWFRNERTTIEGRAVFGDVRMWDEVTVGGDVNGVELRRLSKSYISKSLSRHMYADLHVSNLTILGLSRTRKMSGKVNGANLGEFAPSVLQHGLEQTFSTHANFENIVFDSISGSYSVNGLNLASDVLRYDVQGAVVTGEKTWENVVAEDVVVDSGVMVQTVAVTDWMEQAVLKKEGVVKGNVTFGTIDIEGNLGVKGKVGAITLDRDHMLTKSGNQKITGRKTIVGDFASSRLTVDGLINGVDVRELVEKSAYTDGDVVLSAPLELDSLQTEGLSAEKIAGVNVSRVCGIASNELVVRDLNDEYKVLASASKKIHENIADGAFFLDFYRVVQKFKNNVTAVALVPNIPGPVIAVFRESDSNNATVMRWDVRENIFKTSGSLPGLEGDTKFIAAGPSLLVARNRTSTLLLHGQNSFWSDSVGKSSCVATFPDPKYAACFFIGQQGAADVSMCAKANATQMVVTQTHLTTDCIQATTVRAGNKTWLMVIGGKTRWSRSDVFLTLLSKRDGPAAMFIPRQDLAVLHPISITAAVHGRYCYLVVASQHKPESIRSSLVTVFRYTSSSDKWTRYQEIHVDAPMYVHLAELPTGQLALYVLTENPAKALQVFLYRGVEGFVPETAGLGVRTGSLLTSFTVSGRHYVAIAGADHGQLLQAEMRGSRHG